MRKLTFRALFYDFDGVLADSERLHYLAFSEIFKRYNQPLEQREYLDVYMYGDDRTVLTNVFKDRGVQVGDDEFASLIVDKEKIYEKLLAKSGTSILYPGAKGLAQATAQCVPQCIVSMARKQEIEEILEPAGIRDQFLNIVSVEDCENPKPHPEPYLKALDLVNKSGKLQAGSADPADSLVFEDSVGGVEAGAAAGMTVVGVAHNISEEALKSAGAHYVFENVEAIHEMLDCNVGDNLINLTVPL